MCVQDYVGWLTRSGLFNVWAYPYSRCGGLNCVSNFLASLYFLASIFWHVIGLQSLIQNLNSISIITGQCHNTDM